MPRVREHCDLKWGNSFFFFLRQALPIQLQDTSVQVHAGAGHQVLDWNQNVTVPLLEQMNKTESKTKQKRSTTNT